VDFSKPETVTRIEKNLDSILVPVSLLGSPLAFTIMQHLTLLFSSLPIEPIDGRFLGKICERMNLPRILAGLLIKPPFVLSPELTSLIFKLFIIMASRNGEVGDRIVHSMINELKFPSLMKLFLRYPSSACNASYLDTLLVCRSFIDFKHADISIDGKYFSDQLKPADHDDAKESVRFLSPKNRLPGLWHFATQASATVFDIDYASIGVLKINVDEATGRVTGSGHHSAWGSISIDSSSSTNMPHFDSNFHGMILSGKQEGIDFYIALKGTIEGWMNSAGGMFRLSRQKPNSKNKGDPNDPNNKEEEDWSDPSELAACGGWFAWKDSRPLTASLYDEEKKKVEAHPKLAVKKGVAWPVESTAAEMEQIRTCYIELLETEATLISLCHWTTGSIELAKFYLGPDGEEGEDGEDDEESGPHAQRLKAIVQKMMVRGPHELQSTFLSRCRVVNSIVSKVEALRMMIVSLYNRYDGVTKLLSSAQQVNASSTAAMESWFSRLLICPLINQTDKDVMDAAEIKNYLQSLLEIYEEFRRSGVGNDDNDDSDATYENIHEGNVDEDIKTMLKKEKRKSKRNKNKLQHQMNANTLIIAMSIVTLVASIGAFSFARWLGNRQK
jgi:hypothetical protein